MNENEKTIRLNIDTLQKQCLSMNKELVKMYDTLSQIKHDSKVRITGDYIPSDHIISNLSVSKELKKYATQLHDEYVNYRINNLYTSFSQYMKHAHDIDITNKEDKENYTSPQRLGRLFTNLHTDPLPFVINRRKNAVHRYYDILDKDNPVKPAQRMPTTGTEHMKPH